MAGDVGKISDSVAPAIGADCGASLLADCPLNSQAFNTALSQMVQPMLKTPSIMDYLSNVKKGLDT